MFNHKQQKSEGNAKRKSNRYSILMLALIFIGFATYGTYAYFTDSTSIGADIKLSTGTVSLGQESSSDWKYQPLTGRAKNVKIVKSNTSNTFSNLQPGDSYVMTKTVEYTGSLDAEVSYQDSTKVYDDVKAKGFDLAISVVKLNSDQTTTNLHGKTVDINPKEKIAVTFTVSVPINDTEKYNMDTGSYLQRNNGKTSLNLAEIGDAVTITVNQK